MTYVNINDSTTRHLEACVDQDLVYGADRSFVKKNIAARAAHLGLVPLSLVMNTLDTLVGIGSGIGVVLIGGAEPESLKFALDHLDSSRKILVRPFSNLVKTINPEAIFSDDYANLPYIYRFIANNCDPNPPFISGDGDGFVTDFIKSELRPLAIDCCNSDNFLERHVASRLTFALLAIACLVTRAVDGLICIPAAVASLLTAGKFVSLNNLAYRTLQAPGIIEDLFYCTIKCINPWAQKSF
jgi:hypothetical protein